MLEEPSEDDEFEYGGNTDILWDTQKTIRDKKKRVTLKCDERHMWKSEIITT